MLGLENELGWGKKPRLCQVLFSAAITIGVLKPIPSFED